MIVGFGIPVDLDIESVTIGWVFKAQYFLPENASNFLNAIAAPFDDISPLTIGSHYELNSRAINDPNEQLDEPKASEGPVGTNDTYEKLHSGNSNGFEEALHRNEKYEVPAIELELEKDAPGTDSSNDIDDKREWDRPSFKGHKRPQLPAHGDNSRWLVYQSLAAFVTR